MSELTKAPGPQPPMARAIAALVRFLQILKKDGKTYTFLREQVLELLHPNLQGDNGSLTRCLHLRFDGCILADIDLLDLVFNLKKKSYKNVLHIQPNLKTVKFSFHSHVLVFLGQPFCFLPCLLWRFFFNIRRQLTTRSAERM